MQNPKVKTIDFFIFSVVCSLFAYVVFRAILIDITHDESYSFYNVKHFWYAEALCTGNTHWLNSLAIKGAVSLGFETLGAIRWLSILSAFVFFSLVFIWIRSAKELHLKFFILTIFLFNPYILDYFSLARGYAPGLALQALSLFFFFRPNEKKEKYYLFLSLFFAGLSALANFSFIYFFMAFSWVYFFNRYFKFGFAFLKSKYFYRDALYSLLILALVIRAFIFVTKCSNDIVGAGSPSFKECFQVFSDGLIYLKFNVSPQILNTLSYLTFGIIVASTVYGLVQYKKHNNRIYFFTSLILSIILGLIFINNICFKVVFPYYRSAVFLFPTTAICFICFIKNVIKNEKSKGFVFYSVSISLIINLILSLNFKYSLDFHINASLKESFDFVAKFNPKKVGLSPELYGGFRNYYQMTMNNHYDFIGESINTNLPKGVGKNKNILKEYDYIILCPPYDLSYYQNNTITFKLEKIFIETGIVIMKTQ